ncbi:MAG: chloride channel protein [Actinobacteria bacterium]|nr:chloride channel protein [Actinomycetota bacterium]
MTTAVSPLGSPAPTPPRRLLLLAAAAAGLGLAGGGAAWVLLRLIALLTNVALFHRVGWTLPSLRHLRPGPGLVLAAMAGGLLVSALARWAPAIRGHGIPEAMEAVLTRHSRIAPRTALAKPVSAALAIGTGGPFGAEGPIIVTGGAFGSLLGQVLDVSPSERKILLASGAAAGMAATFGAPLAAVTLAIELLVFELSTRALVPLVVAASVAGAVHISLFGSGPLFAVPVHDYGGLARMPLFAALGVACGLLAILIAKGLFAVEDGFRRLPVNELWHPVLGGLGFALVGLAVPRALGVGYDAISDVLLAKLSLGAVAALAVAKLVAWWVALGSGTSGGTLAPLLLISGAVGSLLGTAARHLVPSAHVAPGAFALVAMAATFGAATRATFTSIVFLFELTRDYHAILPLMLATVVADLVARALLPESLMTEKLARRGLRVRGDYEVDVMRATSVGAVMTKDVETLADGATLAQARRRFEATRHGAYPVVDDGGRCVGIVSRRELLWEEWPPDTPVAEVASSQAVTVEPTTTLLDALHRMLEEGVEHLPVLDDGRLVGICTRTDVLRARRAQLDHEQAQPGWRPSPGLLRGRRAPADRRPGA